MSRHRIVVAVAAIGLMLTSAPAAVRPSAQGQQKPQAVVMKGIAPVSTEVLKIHLPRPAESDLANGLHLMVLEDHRAPQVSFQLLIPGAGGYYDPSSTPGLASMVAGMMREGTTTRTSEQIAETLETMAASLGIGAGMSSVVAQMSGSSLSDHFGETFALAADILVNPSFPSEELDRYKTRTRASLIQQRSNPGFLANEMMAHVLFGDHPAGQVSMTPSTLDSATRETLVAFHHAHYVPDHAVLAIAGDISVAEARTLAEDRLGAWKKAGTPDPTVADPGALGSPKVYFIARPNSVQSSLWVGTQAIARTSPDYDVVSVMNAVIGGGPTGRLFTHLREEKGYTYGAYSNVSAQQFRGTWIASLDVRTDVTEPALRDLLAEVARMRDEPVPTKEFEDRKRGMVASFALSLESPAAVLNSHVTRWLYKLPADYYDTMPTRIMGVTEQQVQAAARKYLDPSRLEIVVVGDPAKVSELLRQFGTVETYDTNGARIGGDR